MISVLTRQELIRLNKGRLVAEKLLSDGEIPTHVNLILGVDSGILGLEIVVTFEPEEVSWENLRSISLWIGLGGLQVLKQDGKLLTGTFGKQAFIFVAPSGNETLKTKTLNKF